MLIETVRFPTIVETLNFGTLQSDGACSGMTNCRGPRLPVRVKRILTRSPRRRKLRDLRDQFLARCDLRRPWPGWRHRRHGQQSNFMPP